MSSRLLLASVVDNGDAATLVSGTPGGIDAGPVAELLAELARTGVDLGSALLRLVTTPDAPALAAAHRWVAACSAAGHGVDAVIVTRVPRTADGFPKSWTAPICERAEAFARECAVPVITMRLRPRGRQVPRRIDPTPCRVQPHAPAPLATDTGFSWRIEIDGIDHVDDVQVGTRGEHLIINLDGVEVSRRLPSALARCRAAGAHIDAAITIAFEPDPRQWPHESPS